MKLTDKVWKYSTVVIVLLVALNPEMANLALFIDVIGLETLLMLYKIQVITIIGALINKHIKPALIFFKYFTEHYLLGIPWRIIKEDPMCLFFALPSQATIMHGLVFFVAASAAFRM